MSFFKKLTDELAKRQGFEAGLEGKPPRIFLSDGEHKEAYDEGYNMGNKGAINRIILNASRKLFE